MAEGGPLRMLVVGMKWPPETFLARLSGWTVPSKVSRSRSPVRRGLAMRGFGRRASAG